MRSFNILPKSVLYVNFRDLWSVSGVSTTVVFWVISLISRPAAHNQSRLDNCSGAVSSGCSWKPAVLPGLGNWYHAILLELAKTQTYSRVGSVKLVQLQNKVHAATALPVLGDCSETAGCSGQCNSPGGGSGHLCILHYSFYQASFIICTEVRNNRLIYSKVWSA